MTDHPPQTAPNAFSKLKQALKGMLKPKKRQDQQDQQQQPQQQKPDQQQQQDGASKPDVPPKQLPPTHPLATGKQSDPQAAVPLAGAGVGAGSAPDAGSTSVGKESAKKEGEDSAPVSPEAPTPIAKDSATKSDPVSAVSSDHDKPSPPPKTDGAADEDKAAGMHFYRNRAQHLVHH